MDLTAVVLTFGAIFVVELPDKTFLATLVLATRYRPVLVWLGVSLAFAVQTGVAVGLGQVATLLPTGVVRGVALALFLLGAVILVREGLGHRADAAGAADESSEEAEIAERARPATGLRAVGASFLVLFAAEWGDLSQLLTLSLVTRYEAPFSVYAGALAALVTVSGLAVLVGRNLLRVVPVHVLHFVGAGVCLVLAALTAYELLA